MILWDYHVHTTFSDGENTMEEMVAAALEKGMTAIGFADHSYTFFDRSYCRKPDDRTRYFGEISRLRETYGKKIRILAGVEQDLSSRKSTAGYDYAVGSVHYLCVKGRWFPIDESKRDFETMVNTAFDGDAYAACRAYFKAVRRIAKRDDIGIVGHFDLIAMFNGDGALFDERDDRYLSAAKAAARALVAAGKVFEINTRALYKGKRSEPYPAKELREYIKEIGGTFLLSSDSHKKEELLLGFPAFEGETDGRECF